LSEIKGKELLTQLQTPSKASSIERQGTQGASSQPINDDSPANERQSPTKTKSKDSEIAEL